MNAVEALARYDDLQHAGATDLVISEGVRRVSHADVKAGKSWVAGKSRVLTRD